MSTSIAIVRDVLLWCTLLNYGLLIAWGLLLLAPHDWLRRLWGRWLHLSPEVFDAINFGGLTLYKMLIFLLNLIPYIALRIAAG